MHIPVKVDYGVRALVDLALHSEEGAIRATDIASRAAVPEPYLVQVLHTMGKSGLIRSVRGPQGGHALAVDPGEIRLSMVMACLGTPQTLVSCLGDVNMCVHVPACAQRDVWRSVEEAVFNILDSTTIADLAKRTREMESAQPRGKAAQPLEVAAV